MKNIIISIGKLRIRIICTLIGLTTLFICIPVLFYVALGCTLFCVILNPSFVFTYTEHMMLRLLHDKNNKYDVYIHIMDGTWKTAYSTTHSDVLAFVLFDPIGKLTKHTPQTKVLSFHQILMLNHFPQLPHIDENQWIQGKDTTVSIMRKGNSFTYKAA